MNNLSFGDFEAPTFSRGALLMNSLVITSNHSFGKTIAYVHITS
jgi:hypothetical protein